MLSKELNYDYDDLDDEIKKRYKKIDIFQEKYPYDYDRHKKRGEILLDIINKYQDDVVIAVSPIFYEKFFISAVEQPKILAIELQDEAENILSRLQYADENDKEAGSRKRKNKRRSYCRKKNRSLKSNRRIYGR